jgi:hypothetical protein
LEPRESSFRFLKNLPRFGDGKLGKKQICYVCSGVREYLMPRGPQGQKRPADAIGCAVTVGRIATGEITEELKPASGKVRSGQAGSKARAEKLSQEERTVIAKKAAAARWG